MAGTGLATHEALVERLRGIDGLVDKGKPVHAWYFKSKAFLHFHGSGGEVWADLRTGADWERVWVRTPEEREHLVSLVVAHLEANPPRRRTT